MAFVLIIRCIKGLWLLPLMVPRARVGMNSNSKAKIAWGIAAFTTLGLIVEVTFRIDEITWQQASLALAAGGPIPAAVYLPAWYSVVGVSIIQFLSGYYFATVHPVLFFLSWIPVIAILWFRGKNLGALLVTIVLVYINSIAPEVGDWQPDFNSAIFMVVFMGVLLAFFELVLRIENARKEEAERSVQMAISLHTQVAGSLTKVLIELEKSPDYFQSKETRGSLEIEIRNALLSTRQLLEILTKPKGNGQGKVATAEYFSDALDMAVHELEDNGFNVIEQPRERTQVKLKSDLQAVIAAIFAELANNLLKYADVNRPVLLNVISLNSDVQVTFSNFLRAEEFDALKSSGLGLSIIKDMITSIGGQIHSGLESPEQWKTTIIIPLA